MKTPTLGEEKMKLVLRPEATAPTMRYLIDHPDILLEAKTRPIKVYYCGSMFRHDRPQKGRYREFFQFGIEHIGTDSVVSDAENIIMANQILKDLHIPIYKLHINSIGTLQCRQLYNAKLQEYFSTTDRTLSEETKDKVAAGMPLFRILDSKKQEDMSAIENAPKIYDCLKEESKLKFDRVQNILKENSVDYIVDHKMVRGLDYYYDICYEFKVEHENLGPSQNTVIGGGRYDSLSDTLGARQIIPASGWAAGINRLIEVIPDLSMTSGSKIDIILALVIFDCDEE